MDIRHAIAHGRALPNYHWLDSNNDGATVSLSKVRDKALPFFRELVTKCDSIVQGKLQALYGVATPW